MRSGQQKNRNRGRNGRKNMNPLSRNYESNGPDVKIRGNASHIAEKYQQLARDATASGDLVMAENYLQHAEHYYRVIAAAQAQFQQSRPDLQGQQPGQLQENMDSEEGDDGDESGGEMNGHVQNPRPAQFGQPPQGGGDRGDQGYDRNRHQHNQHRRRDFHNNNNNNQGNDPARSPQPPVNGQRDDADESSDSN
jgi:hypothetical protein